MNYNYVVFMTKGPFEYMFKDLEQMENVKVFWNITENRSIFIRILIKLHFSHKLNLPGRWIWFNKFFKRKDFDKYFKEKRPIVFIVRAGYDYEFIRTNAKRYLSEHYDNCKFVMPILDTVESCYKRNREINNYEYSMEEMKKIFNLIVTGNPMDVEKYELQYYPEPFSSNGVRLDSVKEYDIFFIGAAKDRLGLIHNVYERLTSADVKCDFWVVGVPDTEQKFPEIKYNTPLTYTDMLKQSCKSRTILEIVQGGTTGFTIRACQALINNQKYITNAQGILNSKYYDSNYVQVFSDADEINAEWIKNPIIVDYKYDDDYSPCELINYLDNYFSGKKDTYVCKWQK